MEAPMEAPMAIPAEKPAEIPAEIPMEIVEAQVEAQVEMQVEMQVGAPVESTVEEALTISPDAALCESSRVDVWLCSVRANSGVNSGVLDLAASLFDELLTPDAELHTYMSSSSRAELGCSLLALHRALHAPQGEAAWEGATQHGATQHGAVAVDAPGGVVDEERASGERPQTDSAISSVSPAAVRSWCRHPELVVALLELELDVHAAAAAAAAAAVPAAVPTVADVSTEPAPCSWLQLHLQSLLVRSRDAAALGKLGEASEAPRRRRLRARLSWAYARYAEAHGAALEATRWLEECEELLAVLSEAGEGRGGGG